MKKEFTIPNIEKILLNEDTWIHLGNVVLRVIIIFILSSIVVRFGKRIIKHVFLVREKSPLTYSERRHTTLMKLLQNILTNVVYFTAIIAILSVFDINVTGLLAGAGIVGLAVGFGAQSLVKDIITGFFIVFEDQFAVGDQVQIGSATGTVEEIGLRTTKVKSYTGELHTIPNGSISVVVNFSIYNSKALIDVSVAYETNMEELEKSIERFLQALPIKYEELVKSPTYLGVQSFSSSEIVIRIAAETKPMQQSGIARNIRRDLIEFLEQEGIKIP
ncbi:mechanosensitive ion channel family protein [Psychrobacillus glaciei]|uniref:Mechanosensitive ion channel family protein n=1 Tax=Psychrobacillus glaciei TaxID=2283160 RepID=A0A5J6SSK5_9BACI|nr:mechanosensitive ion channel family protein [Psychrobacillus glaciei]QFG01029.1 mechanosensitive ion channel family protein [Psychrobacillus glaciei]